MGLPKKATWTNVTVKFPSGVQTFADDSVFYSVMSQVDRSGGFSEDILSKYKLSKEFEKFARGKQRGNCCDNSASGANWVWYTFPKDDPTPGWYAKIDKQPNRAGSGTNWLIQVPGNHDSFHMHTANIRSANAICDFLFPGYRERRAERIAEAAELERQRLADDKRKKDKLAQEQKLEAERKETQKQQQQQANDTSSTATIVLVVSLIALALAIGFSIWFFIGKDDKLDDGNSPEDPE